MLQTSKLISGRQLRTWWAMRLQKRRRDGAAAPLPPFPIVTLANGSWENAGSWYSNFFDIFVDHKTWPVANLEIWLNPWNGFTLLAIVGSDSPGFTHDQASEGEGTFIYKARYRNGQNVGQFSNDMTIEISI